VRRVSCVVPKFYERWSTNGLKVDRSFYPPSLFCFVSVHPLPSMRHCRGDPQRLWMKRHWIRLQLRFEAPNAISLGSLKWHYVAIIATFSSFAKFWEGQLSLLWALTAGGEWRICNFQCIPVSPGSYILKTILKNTDNELICDLSHSLPVTLIDLFSYWEVCSWVRKVHSFIVNGDY